VSAQKQAEIALHGNVATLSGLRIVAPETMDDEMIDAVLACSPGSWRTEEVARGIVARFATHGIILLKMDEATKQKIREIDSVIDDACAEEE